MFVKSYNIACNIAYFELNPGYQQFDKNNSNFGCFCFLNLMKYAIM